MVRKKRRNERVARPIHPNVGIELAYRRAMLALIDKMHRSITYWVAAAWRANEPEMAMDDSPARSMRRAMRQLSRRWSARFDEAAPKLAAYFAQDVAKRSDAALRKILKDAGIAIEFKMTREANDVLQATIGAQVGLIKTIPQQYLASVEGAVMRSIQRGGDLASLTKELQIHYGVTRRRAAFIARDQNNKANAVMTRARQLETGLNEAVWVHSGGGREPRPSHVAAGKRRERYDVSKGWWDPHEKRFILPGELPNCRCVSRAVIPGFV